MTYRINSILYGLRQIPEIKHLFSVRLYGNKKLKMLITILALLWEVLSVFINKGLYVGICIYLPIVFSMPKSMSLAMLHIVFFLTIAGAVSNNTMFDPTKDKYYAMISLRMDAKAYTFNRFYLFHDQNIDRYECFFTILVHFMESSLVL